MMYKAIVVDDEKMIRQGIQSSIPWYSIGIKDVFTAKSGEEALKIIQEQKPEIMITDIKMSGMTGLQLVGQAKKIVPQIRVLVLSGYDEFEYARKCIQLNVYDFFLKPMDEKVLIGAIRKQVSFLDAENNNKLEESNETRVQAVTDQLKIESFLRKLIHSESSPGDKDIAEFCKSHHYNPDQNMRVAVIMPMLYMESDCDANHYLTLSIQNICMEMVDAQSRGLTFLDGNGCIAIAFFIDNKKKSIYERVEELIGILKDECGKKLKVAVGNPIEGFMFLRMSYNDAISLLQETTTFDEIIQTKSIQRKDNLFHEICGEFENAMCSNLTDPERVVCIFERFCRATDTYNLSDSYIQKCCFKLASSLFYTFMKNSGAEADSRLTCFLNSLVITNGADALELTKQFITRLLDNKDGKVVDEIVEKAKQFILGHLAEDLSLPKIASMLYISPNYLSRLFKKSTGEGFNEYIVRKRIEKAKLLLETTNLKTNRIAMLVGYRDTNYFSLAVKKSVGMSPKNYRDVYQKNAMEHFALG